MNPAPKRRGVNSGREEQAAGGRSTSAQGTAGAKSGCGQRESRAYKGLRGECGYLSVVH